MSREKKYICFFVIISIFAISFVFVPSKNLIVDVDRSLFNLASGPIIDGNLEEWENSTYKIAFFLDADETNADGYNYLYLHEDFHNIYLGLDLCSDQTANEIGEWIGIWLNTNETTINETSESEAGHKWAAAINKGIESLLYSVEDDNVVPFFRPQGSLQNEYKSIQSVEEMEIVHGLDVGNISDVQSNDGKYFTIISEINGTEYMFRIDFEITISEYFRSLPEVFANATQKLTFHVTSKNNISILDHSIYFRDPITGSINFTNPALNKQINLGTTLLGAFFGVEKEGNFTADNKVLISLIGTNDQPFNTSIDEMGVALTRNQTNDIAGNTIYFPFSSIESFDISWGFGPSENNASDHRMFELRIPKTELEGYQAPTPLGILIGGYGTLSAWPNTHNWVYANGINTGIPEENTSAYYYYIFPVIEEPTDTTTSDVPGTTSRTTTTETSTTTPVTTSGDPTTSPDKAPAPTNTPSSELAIVIPTLGLIVLLINKKKRALK